MKILIGIIITVILLIFVVFLNTSTKPSKQEIEITTPDDKILRELRPELIKEYETVVIKDDATNKMINDNKDLWNEWQKNGYKPTDTLTVDFYYYSADEENAKNLKQKLDSEGFVANIYPEKTLMLKGWKIKAQIRRVWDIQTIEKYVKVMAVIGDKEGTYLEGYAAMMKN
jgi:hypothetical protein